MLIEEQGRHWISDMNINERGFEYRGTFGSVLSARTLINTIPTSKVAGDELYGQKWKDLLKMK